MNYDGNPAASGNNGKKRAGRKAGVPNRLTARKRALKESGYDGLVRLHFLAKEFQQKGDKKNEIECIKIMLPYELPRLAATHVAQAGGGMSAEDWVTFFTEDDDGV